MEKSLQTRVSVVLLAVLTLAAVAFAFLNFAQESHTQFPTDGVIWMEGHGGLVAEHVLPGSPGQLAGIKAKDILVSANGAVTDRIAQLAREEAQTRVYGTIHYTLIRRGIRLVDVPVILAQQDESLNQGLRLIALVYLCIGFYVLFRRWTAPHSLHFYIFCLVSFVLYAFHYTGQFDLTDQVVYWSGIVAAALQPALFLHFGITFPEDRPRRRYGVLAFVYLPAVLIVALQVVAQQFWQATEVLKHHLDQIALGYLAAYYLITAVVLWVHYHRSRVPLRRQQLKWLVRGTVIAIVPFTVLYVAPFLASIPEPSLVTKLAGISLVFLPLTFSWAIVRYRLMDTDLIFKRGVTYTLATALLVGVYFGVVAVTAETAHRTLPKFGGWGLIIAVILTAQVFDPLKKLIQRRVDKLFDRQKYDYRSTLIEFGRSLSTETDMDALMNAIADRLPHTLLVERVAVFLSDQPGHYRLAKAHGFPASLMQAESTLDLNFLDFDQPDAGSHIFFENTQAALHLTESEQRSVNLLDLNYYLPCRVQDRTIAVIGLGKTTGGDFLSSEDMEMLESLASYIGIALQNARLYSSLEQKITEFERLKEFNENIVESINVGILAVDLEDRVESWNTQMEVLFALPRREALRQPLSEVFPESLYREYQTVKEQPGVHHFYKFRLQTNAGESRTVNVAVAPLVSRDFETVGRILLLEDITDRTQLESQLSQAEKLSSIGLLAAGVAHEVNTPLAVISSYTQMLSKQVRGDDRLSPLLDKITQQTFRASEIVNGLLNFSRTGTSEFRETDVNTLIRETLTLVEHQFKTAQIELVMDLSADLPTIRGNAGKLQQVFLNLFLNAKDAMHGGGQLRVSTLVNGHVTIAITDTGSGISPENMQKIYDPFFTTKSAPKEGQRRGTGLGLAVTYGIIQEHAGKIRVESEVGCGTTFYLEFPVLRKPAHV
ncbi:MULTISPECIES: ATP-binding protein [Acidobacterium]|nr:MULTISPECIES: ATP-binding protein [Acidobacterium]HCT61553.1 PAS domain S-box protein [Acidobacterium sp.]